MVTAIDTSVLVDVLIRDPTYATDAKACLRPAASEGSLVICETVLAEIAPSLEPSDIPQFLQDWGLIFLPSSQESALLAGKMFRLFLRRGGKRGRVAADFLIGAHAQTHAERLLARDRGYYRDYFKALKVWDPTEKS